MTKLLESLNLDPIDRESIAEKVVNKILSLVQSGNLKPGDKLPSEKELMTVFSVSRPTLREALRALSILGITATKKGGGTYISELKAADLLRPLEFFVSIEDQSIRDIFECRRILECEMVAKAAACVTDQQLIEFDQLISVQKEAVKDPVAFRISDQKFHELLATISGNVVLARLADGMYNIAMDARRKATEMEGVLPQSIADHIAIVNALKKKDSTLASEAMREHLNNIENSTLLAISNE
ncbi:regulatory protein, gntR family [Marinomonas polaris DSM 16579]|jgi:GntR family transcriptional regulator, transcriptional repressor for pyruvate dehydrogenase complex|uniref:Regulatory protein, gntR family n=1 Tax=Marinomonas polaris DSM 16579 TaxID=1122206 RepID=A0A1M4VAV0_9GAMM|nr:FadR/GntR family transcriptional regulator [Marinomonas polaris]SHE66033.1 regulatory protein, gntR family [Marinomonas polaris DSM 16579]